MTKLQRLMSYEENWQKRSSAAATAAAVVSLSKVDSHLESILAATATTNSDLVTRSPKGTGTSTSWSRSPKTESEIVVRIEGMDLDEVSSDAGASTPPKPVPATQLGQPSLNDAVDSQSQHTAAGDWDLATKASASLESSTRSEPSLLTSPPSTIPPSSKATTPIDTTAAEESHVQVPARPEPTIKIESTHEKVPDLPTPVSPARKCRRQTFDVRPKISIPNELPSYEYANQCIAAAEASRLNPYALHQEEYSMLRDHISHSQVTTYLNIRNGILRLWLHNPRLGVARDEAVGCAKDTRWFDVANVCYDWLVRNGFINFGCTEVPTYPRKRPARGKSHKKGKTIVVIGAGMSGLGCARQLDSLFKQYSREFNDLGEEVPHVVVLEGRNRVGGRVYSRAIDGSQCQRPVHFKGRRHSVECGGMIITGFDRGNPLNVLVRGQMGLPYYALRPETTLYDSNGKAVDEARDRLVEKLYNDCLERVSEYKFKIPPAKLIEGARELIDEGRDGSSDNRMTIAQAEEATAALPQATPVSKQSLAPQVSLVPVATDRATGRAHVEPGTPATFKAAHKARLLGWALKEGVTEDDDLELDGAVHSGSATLGSIVDLAISQYKNLVDLNPLDFRLMNWHVANLEYSNATNYNQLSIGGWDIDAGYEWEGKHTMVVGGYQSVPWGLGNAPSRLDIRKNAEVKTITYDPEGSGRAKVECADGSTVDADYVVSTVPLGVLKHGNVEFNPPLPSWKTGPVGRLGFGILNKVILVFKESFWDSSRDIFGILREPLSRHSVEQSDYASQRGRCFQWFDVSHTSGVPVLLALMAGDAGFDTEHSSNDDLVAEATQVLRGVFGAKVPNPIQSVVTRWGSDKFARGSYSSAGPTMQPEDYKLMARPVGNLFFAGEHTTDTHPATVHGAYLSGLRAASEVITALLGPISIPTPLIIPRESTALAPAVESLKRKADSDLNLSATSSSSASPLSSSRATKQARIDAHELAAWEHIRPQIGERPWPPQKVAGNAYLLYSKQNFEAARQRCIDEGLARRQRSGKKGGNSNNSYKPSPNDVRVMTSRMWKETQPETRKPFEDEAAELKAAHLESRRKWEEECKEWDTRYLEIRAAWDEENKLSFDDGVEVMEKDQGVGSGPGSAATAGRGGDRDGRREAMRHTTPTKGRRAARGKVSSYTESEDDGAAEDFSV
ncbi:flavin-containing amine oxidoreductase-domain containing protein [Microdochium trichocladiopsis]|uniref:Flavin-containing amine oxidoreductase-domain containing protein n=1 Tax=Microdochium trichocladiopsis TaxID=1682393 RepID=A0A9P8Y1J2_9PEZI|nr:flavin-containing amine oxidoreductase-domain containing protein [Microdochium trichocladiopsis]KAH7027497.1 flavin-containing amine oxidoreductase-domain containing protein [Microdochium trichocladiopsis]